VFGISKWTRSTEYGPITGVRSQSQVLRFFAPKDHDLMLPTRVRACLTQATCCATSGNRNTPYERVVVTAVDFGSCPSSNDDESDDVRRDAIRKVLFADRGRFDGRSVCRKQRKYRFRIASFYASVMQFSLSTCKTQSLHEKKRLAQNSFDFQVRTVNYGCTAATEMLSSAARTLRAKKIC
jgi:hypothetical protein